MKTDDINRIINDLQENIKAGADINAGAGGYSIGTFERGWMVEDEGDHFEVYYATHEAMRLGADGSLYVGRPEPYIFKTREWAQLCADRLNSLDRAFGATPSNMVFYGGNLGIGTTSPQYKFHVSGGPTPIFTMDQNHTLTYVNVPYIVKVWLRSTALWRGLKRLWYGERNEQR